MIKTCKYCGQAVICPDETELDGWEYCNCPDAIRQIHMDRIIEEGREAVECFCGIKAGENGLNPVSSQIRFTLLSTLPSLASGDLEKITIKLSPDGDKITMKVSKGEIVVERSRTTRWGN